MSIKGFELHKYYEHFGGNKIHIIAEAEKSDMWIIDKNTKMSIAEDREGNLSPVGGSVQSAANWYEITRNIFVDDLSFKELKVSVPNDIPIGQPEDLFAITIKHEYRLRLYSNGTLFLFDLAGYNDDCGLARNIAQNDPVEALRVLKDHITDEQLIYFEKLLFSGM